MLRKILNSSKIIQDYLIGEYKKINRGELRNFMKETISKSETGYPRRLQYKYQVLNRARKEIKKGYLRLFLYNFKRCILKRRQVGAGLRSPVGSKIEGF